MLIKDIEKMEAYTPTEYVNDSEPDLDADNLNKTERQLRDTVAKANEIIDTLKSLISNVSVNSEDTVPSSAVAYKMEQDIKQLNSNFTFKKKISLNPVLGFDGSVSADFLRLGNQVSVNLMITNNSELPIMYTIIEGIPENFKPLLNNSCFIVFRKKNTENTFCAFCEGGKIRTTEQSVSPGTWYASTCWSAR